MLLKQLRHGGWDKEALDAGQRASALIPQEFGLQLQYHLYLPKVYQSEDEISSYKTRLAHGLDQCSAKYQAGSPVMALSAAGGFSRYTNFAWAYQGSDDRELIVRYANLLTRVMQNAYPQLANLPRPRRKIPRVGVLSAYFSKHTVGEHFLGWLSNREPDDYEVLCYYLGDAEDSLTAKYRRSSDGFKTCRKIETAVEAIWRDQLDVLVFTDVGMHPIASQIAALRLASVQCVAFGHPVTTGLPSIDYLLSPDLAEPADGQSHYTETLIRLPNLGISYTLPAIPGPLLTKIRADFGLRQDSVVYLCCQPPFKHLPQYDEQFAEIAAEVPRAEFVFFASTKSLGQKLLKRLDAGFSRKGLSVQEVVRVLPYQTTLDYSNLQKISDVLLDPIGCSGARSTLDAVACGLPVVTLPGHTMRLRQASGILTALGCRQTVCSRQG